MKLGSALFKCILIISLLSWSLGSFGHSAAAAIQHDNTPTLSAVNSEHVESNNLDVIVRDHDNKRVANNTYLNDETSSSVGSAAYPTNTTKKTAIELQPNIPIQAYLPPTTYEHGQVQGGSLYYKVTLTKKQKMTFLMMMPPGINYHMYMDEAAALRNSGPYQQMSYADGPGTYYVHITEGATAGSFTQPFNLKVMLTDKFDRYEALSDDSPTTANYSWWPTEQTIDNPFDEDWKMILLVPAPKFTIQLDNPSIKGIYKLELYDDNDHLIASMPQGVSKTFELPEGIYYTRVYSPKGTYDADELYTLNFEFHLE